VEMLMVLYFKLGLLGAPKLGTVHVEHFYSILLFQLFCIIWKNWILFLYSWLWWFM